MQRQQRIFVVWILKVLILSGNNYTFHLETNKIPSAFLSSKKYQKSGGRTKEIYHYLRNKLRWRYNDDNMQETLLFCLLCIKSLSFLLSSERLSSVLALFRASLPTFLEVSEEDKKNVVTPWVFEIELRYFLWDFQGP